MISSLGFRFSTKKVVYSFPWKKKLLLCIWKKGLNLWILVYVAANSTVSRKISMLPSLTSCFSNAPARAWTSASNNAVPRMTLLREEREACTICTNRMALYLSSCTNDVTGDSSPVSAGAESFIWISWDPWAMIKQHKSMINKNVLQTGVTLMFLCKLHLNTEVYG